MCDQTAFYRRLGEIADTNLETLPANTPRQTRFRYIDLSAVEVGSINWTTVEETTFGSAPSRARRLVRPLDTLFGTVRPNLQSHGFIGANEPGLLVASTGFSVVRARDGVSHPAYLFHSLMSSHVTAQAVRDAIGSSYPALNDADVKRLCVFAPPFYEQAQIAKVLDILDTTIRETGTIIAKLKAVKQGLLHDLLTRGVDASGELRPPQAESPHLYKHSPLGWIPSDWIIRALGEVAPKDRSVIRTGPFGSSLKGEHWREKGTPVVTIGSLRDGFFESSELLFVDKATTNRLADFALIPGDVVFSRVADVGRSVVITENERGWIMSSNFMRISCDREIARPNFLQTLLSNSLLVRNQLRRTVNSGGRDVANSAVLLGLNFPWPSPAEQDEILAKIGALNDRLIAEENELKKMSDVKTALMSDLLTGRVRVTPLLTEAAQEKECA
jgi:type I restriction enzyme S subunit